MEAVRNYAEKDQEGHNRDDNNAVDFVQRTVREGGREGGREGRGGRRGGRRGRIKGRKGVRGKEGRHLLCCG